MSWPVVTLDSIKADVPYACVGGPFGSNLTSKHYVDEGVPVIRGQNLGGPGCFNEAGFVFVTPEKADKLRPNLAFRGDLLFTQRGTLGQVGLIPQDSQYERYVVSQSQMKLTVDANRVDARFVYQYFRLPSTIQEILNRTITAGVPHINLGILKAFEIPLPPLSIQRAIAEVAQTYDDLIATNQRRIALLEDAARRLYREWFVHLRFPGHESVPVKDGVPEGWSLVGIGECFDFHIGGGWGKENSESGSSEAAHVIRGTDIPRIRDGELGGVPLRFHPERNLASRRLEPGDLVFEVSGGSRDQGVGRLLNVTSQLLDQFDNPVMCASFCKLIRPKCGLSEFLACTLEHLRVTDSLKSFENQSASNIVNFAFSDFCEKQLTLVPTEMVLRAFCSTVASLWQQATTLAQEQAKLARARDLLLPKLMSGQLDVSGIRLPDEVAA